MNIKYRAQKKQRKKNDRNRKVICFNTLYNKQISTNIAKRSLNLLDQRFPKQHRLCKKFNRNNLKVGLHRKYVQFYFISQKKLLNIRK